MAKPKRGEVWLVDLGMAAKTRPCLVVSVTPGDDDRDVATLVGHTTSTRQSRFEAVVPCDFLKVGAFNIQEMVSVARASTRFQCRLGALDAKQLDEVMKVVRQWLGLVADDASTSE